MTRPAVLVRGGKTLIAVIMDRSASMETCRADMQAAYDAFIAGQQAVADRCTVSLYQFDDNWEPVYEDVALPQVPPLSLEPRGGTALQDAIARTISAVYDKDADQVVVVIITDGEENSSTELPGDDGARKVAHMIRRRQAEGWRFIFLGADQDAFSSASRYGIGREQSLSYASTATRQAMSSVTDLVLRGRASGDWSFQDPAT
jgi:Mg-chelatase subunit ChlD